MKKHMIISLFIIIVLIAIPIISYASSPLTISFGGKVLTTSIPDVDCYSSGTGPIVLMSNLMSVASVAYSTSGASKAKIGSRVGSVAKGIYGAIPFYTTNAQKTPQVGDWLLGRANIIPDFSTCDIQIGTYQIPFPVKTSSDYNTSSKNSSFSSF